ncbi:nitrate- and nitrite sensing domain-containing protein [Streptomyces sp. GC420]|uniref:sensor histidine kinase n=1 Tax=Streptomyces sp. GC420 TaxID=2697568 RepID=UPI001414F1AA|nr:nitrate- and nitrite sensing domain-containing protein [Streptomyces sp. GC420]NBM15167.1 histidine kinase [Streptomyces sp. GC420]
MAVVLAVPTCLLLALVGLGVADRAADWSAARSTESEVGVLLRVQALVRELQRERGLTNGLLAGAEEYRDEVAAQRQRTDEARAGLRAALAGDSTARDTGAAASAEDALIPLGDLTPTRTEVDAGVAERAGTLAFYTDAVTALIDAETATVPGGDRRTADGVQALHALARATEAVALERGSLNGVFAAGRFRAGEYLSFTETRAARLASVDQFDRLATSAQRSALDTAFRTEAAHRAAGYERSAERGADGSRLSVTPRQWWEAMTTLVDDLHGVQRQVGDDLRGRASAAGDAATRQLLGFLTLGVLILAVAVALAVFSARSITRPLGALADEADEVAGTRLPHAVKGIQETDPDEPLATRTPEPVRGTDDHPAPGSAQEIGRLAAALRNVERTAVGLAAEQALLRRNSTESLASLGRRNQALISRQLGLLTTLERQELDPDSLADLFRLDHLATRMRRNAESLLVLAGEEAPARSWPGTVTVTEVVQSAAAEVEEYQRVSVVAMEECRLPGHAVAELSHLLAELIENALTFSSPAQPVAIHGWRDADEYCIAVVDRGTGMTAEQLVRSNARLSGRESFLVAPTRFLGHYVVGVLAARLGAHVELRPTEGSEGTTAYVALPASLVRWRDAHLVTAAADGAVTARTAPASPRGRGHDGS